MSKVKKESERKNSIVYYKERLYDRTASAGNYFLKIYFFILMAVFPFYMKEGYSGLGTAKYLFFRNISLIIMIIMGLTLTVMLLCRKKGQKRQKESGTDLFIYGYSATAFLSFLTTEFDGKAWLGAEGWYMGLASQLTFVFIYIMFSRYFKWKNNMLYIALAGSGIVFLLGILNRYSIYPIPLQTKSPDFISTLGNINWFCGYWSVLAPLGIMLYWISRNGLHKTAAGIYAAVCFVSGITQGSRSVYFALAAVFILIFCLSFQENSKMQSFLEICILFILSARIAGILRYLPGFSINYEDELGNILTDSGLTVYIGIAVLIIYILFRYLTKRRGFRIDKYKVVRRVVMIAIAVIIPIYIILTAANTYIPEGIGFLAGRQAFIFDDKWGNGRSVTFKCGLLAYRSMSPLQKLVGVGPDCFAEYVYTIPELAERIYAEFEDARLTNAHSEWITMLVNMGALGVICYAGIFISAFMRFIKKASKKPFLYLCAASVLAYTAHNMVSFQQVLNAPFVFLIMGIGEGVLREEERDG